MCWSDLHHYTLPLQYTEGKITNAQSLVLSVGRGASQPATRRALKESASRWTSNSPETPLWAQRLQEKPQTWQGYKEGQVSSPSQHHTRLSGAPSRLYISSTQQRGHTPREYTWKSLAVQGTTARGGCASWAGGAWAQHPTCLCLQPQPGVYC